MRRDRNRRAPGSGSSPPSGERSHPRAHAAPTPKKSSTQGDAANSPPSAPAAPLKIIGGDARGRKLVYSGDPRTRPMKHRVREALFNLIGSQCAGRHAIDLFSGTGALGLEAISRGAARATCIERHFPTAAQIRENARTLGYADRTEVLGADCFYWARAPWDTAGPPWLVFISPPWELFTTHATELMALAARLQREAPQESMVIVEADSTFDPAQLPTPEAWRVCEYPPARVAIWRGEAPQRVAESSLPS